MKKAILIALVALVLGGTAGYVVYAKACAMNGGKCCGRCEQPPDPR